MLAQLCEYINIHWTVYFIWVNFMICEVDLNKAIKKNLKKKKELLSLPPSSLFSLLSWYLHFFSSSMFLDYFLYTLFSPIQGECLFAFLLSPFNLHVWELVTCCFLLSYHLGVAEGQGDWKEARDKARIPGKKSTAISKVRNDLGSLGRDSGSS